MSGLQPKPRIEWAAPNLIGIAHALTPNRRLPTACGLPPWEARYDWPIHAKCKDCLAAVEGVPIAS